MAAFYQTKTLAFYIKINYIICMTSAFRFENVEKVNSLIFCYKCTTISLLAGELNIYIEQKLEICQKYNCC